jgi:hypothetical protein
MSDNWMIVCVVLAFASCTAADNISDNISKGRLKASLASSGKSNADIKCIVHEEAWACPKP